MLCFQTPWGQGVTKLWAGLVERSRGLPSVKISPTNRGSCDSESDHQGHAMGSNWARYAEHRRSTFFFAPDSLFTNAGVLGCVSITVLLFSVFRWITLTILVLPLYCFWSIICIPFGIDIWWIVIGCGVKSFEKSIKVIEMSDKVWYLRTTLPDTTAATPTNTYVMFIIYIYGIITLSIDWYFDSIHKY